MTGVIMRIVNDRMFGFIRGEDGKDYFFHKNGFNGFFDDLITDVESGRKVRVTFEPVPSEKGPRAGNVSRTDGGV